MCQKEQLPDLYRSVDKFDKIGADGVQRELTERGIAGDAVSRMMDLIQAKASGAGSLDLIADAIGACEQNGVDELRELAALLAEANVPPSML